MTVRRVPALERQTPFVHGAGMLVRGPAAALRRGCCEAGLVPVFFRDAARAQLMAHAVRRSIGPHKAAHRLAHAIVPARSLTYIIRHLAKVTWPVHQHRITRDGMVDRLIAVAARSAPAAAR